MLSLLYLVVKTKQYIVISSYMFLDEKTVLEIWLNPRFKSGRLREVVVVRKLAVP